MGIPPARIAIDTRLESSFFDHRAESLTHCSERCSPTLNNSILIIVIHTGRFSVIGVILISNGVLNVVVDRKRQVAWLKTAGTQDIERAFGLHASAFGIPGI